MGILEIIGYLGALLIGFVMGLMGAGGSILAVPILAYLFHLDEKTATAYSLFIVGMTAAFGGIKQIKSGKVDKVSVLAFGIPSVISVTLVRRFLIPALPDVLFHIGDFEVTRRMGMFGLFAVLMILAAFSMFLKKEKLGGRKKSNFNLLMITEGVFIGGLTGFVGAGGGFLIVPALMIIAGLKIKNATATSLVITSMNSLIGFFGGDLVHLEINWRFLLFFMSVAFLGVLLGIYLSSKVNSESLKKVFGVFILLMAILIFTVEFMII